MTMVWLAMYAGATSALSTISGGESANATELNANWFYYYFNGIPAGFYYFYAYFTLFLSISTLTLHLDFPTVNVSSFNTPTYCENTVELTF